MKCRQSFGCQGWFLIAMVLLASCGDDRGVSPSPSTERGGSFADAARDGSGDGGAVAGDGAKDSPATDTRSDGKVDAGTSGNAGSDMSMAGGSGGSTGNAGTGGTGGSGGSAGAGTGGTGGINAAACEACEKEKCRSHEVFDDLYAACMEAAGAVKDGNAKGVLKKDMCLEVLACIRRTNCANIAEPSIGGMPCFCGENVSSEECLAGSPKGPCRTEFEDGAETAMAFEVGERLNDPQWAVGAAVSMVLYCDADACKGPCLGQSAVGGAGGSGNNGTAGTGGASTAGTGGAGTAGTTATGTGGTSVSGTGGTTGTGGSSSAGTGGTSAAGTGGTSAAGTGGTSASGTGGAGGGGMVTYTKCRECELKSECKMTLEDCEANPLCVSALACIRRMKCALPGDAQPCYCGTADVGGCLTGKADGQCKAEIEAASGTTNPMLIAERFSMPGFASGLAGQLIGCDEVYCAEECKGDPPGTVPATGGTSGTGTGGMSGTGGTAATGGMSGAGGAGTGGTGGVATGGIGGASATGGVGGTGGVAGMGGMIGSGGTGGAAVDAPPDAPTGPCPDLDNNGIADCQESLVMNPDLDTGPAGWLPDGVSSLRWASDRDAQNNTASGALAVTNTTVASQSGVSMGGAQQCVPVTAAGYRVMAEAFIAAGQSPGHAVINIYFFDSADCSGAIRAPFTSTAIGDTGGWRRIDGGVVTPPAGVRSARIKLAVAKDFAVPPLEVLFDNVLLRRL